MKPDQPAGSSADTDVPGVETYRFGDVVVDATAHTLSRQGQLQALEPKVFAALLVLLRQAGRLVPRDDLLDAVWGHRHVTPGVLTRAIAQLREALGDDAHHPRYIQTQHALGYRFIGRLSIEPASLPQVEPVDDVSMATTSVAQSAPPFESDPQPGSGSQPEPGPGSGTAARLEPQVPVSSPPPDGTGWQLPHAGRERRNERAWRWSWPAVVLLGVVLGTVFWLDKRVAPSRATAPVAPSIAVLPFVTLSDDRQDRYFAEGLSTEMLDALAAVPGLKVAAAPPADAVDRKLGVKALGHQLGVANLLDASVRREGKRLRINARLSDAATGMLVWSRSYDRDTGAVFDTQSEIADEVVKSLVGALSAANRKDLRKHLTPTRNVAAFDAYLQGKWLLLQSGEAKDPQRAIDHFSEALSRDPDFARAQAGVCRAETARFEYMRAADAFAKAELACRRAETMDPSMPEIQLAMGDLYRVSGRYDRAVELYTVARNASATRVGALLGLGGAYAALGKREQSAASLREAQAIDPTNERIYIEIGWQDYLDGRLDLAIKAYEKALELHPRYPTAWATLGFFHMQAGHDAQAEAAFNRSNRIQPNYAAVANLGELKYQQGRYAEAVALYHEAMKLDAGDFYLWGLIGDALWADGAPRAQVRAAFAEAIAGAERYLKAKPDDAMAIAALGAFHAYLGQREPALGATGRSLQLTGSNAGDVAMFNAEAYCLLGDLPHARESLQRARSAGVPESRISSVAVFQHAGLVPGARKLPSGMTAASNPGLKGKEN